MSIHVLYKSFNLLWQPLTSHQTAEGISYSLSTASEEQRGSPMLSLITRLLLSAAPTLLA